MRNDTTDARLNAHTTIGLRQETKAQLDRFRAPGQCYDGFISQLVDLWEETYGAGLNTGPTGERRGARARHMPSA